MTEDLVFEDRDDWDRFDATRSGLLEEFAGWLGRERELDGQAVDELVWFVQAALDWKFSYADANLALWDRHDVAEFLLEWCPRKIAMGADQSQNLPEALASYIEFLDRTGRLADGSDRAEPLAAMARLLVDDHRSAMSDPGSFGVAKSLMTAAAAEGVDLEDQSAIMEWVQGFNDRPFEERSKILTDEVVGGGPAGGISMSSMPPVVVPDDAEVEASMADAPVLRAFASLAGYVGGGRKLTATGNLTLADARQLVPLLATGDRMDEEIGDRTFRTRSAGDLPGLQQIMTWAYKAGIVRKANGKVIATKRGLTLADNPAAHFDRVIDALLAVGPLRSQRDPDHWLAWPDVNEVLDEGTVHLLAMPYAADGPVEIDQMAELASRAVHREFRFDGDPEIVERRIRTDVKDLVATLALAGLAEVRSLNDPTSEPAEHAQAPTNVIVALTPAGVVTTRRLLTDAGYHAPSAGGLAGLDATGLLLAVEDLDYPSMRAEISAWLRRRSPQEAVTELAAAVVSLDALTLQTVALAIMSEIDVALAEPEVRSLADLADRRGLALCWLVDHGLEEPGILLDPDDLTWFVDVLAMRLVGGGPGELHDTLALAGGHDAQIRTITGMWRSPSASTDLVLAAIGETHPARPVAKAARKAVLQRRSWQANTN